MTTLFADSVTLIRRGSLDAVHLCNHFATVAEERTDGFQVEVCAGPLPVRCRAGFGPNDFGAVDELERLGSDIPVKTVIAELAKAD